MTDSPSHPPGPIALTPTPDRYDVIVIGSGPGGASVAHDFHVRGLVDRYVLYLAPALFGGDDARPLFAGDGVATIADLWRGEVRSVTSLGDDIRVELAPPDPPA